MQNIQKKHYGGLKNVRIRDFNKKYKSIVYKLKLVGSANFKVLFKLRTVISRNKVFVYT